MFTLRVRIATSGRPEARPTEVRSRGVNAGKRPATGGRTYEPAATGVGFSIGTPTMLPHSVHDPS